MGERCFVGGTASPATAGGTESPRVDYLEWWKEALIARIEVEQILEQADAGTTWEVQGWMYGAVVVLGPHSTWLIYPSFTPKVFVPGSDPIRQALAESIGRYYEAMRRVQARWHLMGISELALADLPPPVSVLTEDLWAEDAA